MESENNVKPENIPLDVENSIKPDFDLDVSMLTEEAYKLEKQQKQLEMIQKANEVRETPSEKQLPAKIPKWDITQIEDYLYFLNEALIGWNINPLTEEEINKIMDLIKGFKGFSLSKIVESPSRSFVKDARKAWNAWKVIRDIFIPRFKPIVSPIFKEKIIPFFRIYFKINLRDIKNEQE